MKVIELAGAGGGGSAPFLYCPLARVYKYGKQSFVLRRSCKFVNRLNCCHFSEKTLHCVYSWLMSGTYSDSEKLLSGKGPLGRLTCRVT